MKPARKLRFEQLGSRDMFAVDIDISNGSAKENDGYVEFNVTLDETSSRTVSVKYETSSDSARSGRDFISQRGTLSFSPGQTSKTIRVQLIDDKIIESLERFNVRLSSPSRARINDGRAVGSIIDNDTIVTPPPTPTPQLTITDKEVIEGNSGVSTVNLTVNLSAASTNPVTVNYTTVAGTATDDFLPTNGILTFAPGETSKTIGVVVNGDTTVESDELFTVTLSGATNATISDSSATVKILNDDSVTPPPPTNTTFFTVNAKSGTQSGTIQVTGTAGTQWVNVAAFLPVWVKVSNDVSPVDGTYTLSVDTTKLPNGTVTIDVVAFSVPAGQSGGTTSVVPLTLSVNNGVVDPPPTSTIPSAPTGLTATALSTTQIRLNWTDTSNNESSFLVERSANGTSGWSQIGSVVANVATFTNSGLTSGTTYFYRVRASNDVGESAFTPTVSAITQPAPTNDARLIYRNALTSLGDLARVKTVTAQGDSTKFNGNERQYYLDYNANGGNVINGRFYEVFSIVDGGLQIRAMRAEGLPQPLYSSDAPNDFISGAFSLEPMLYGYVSADMKFTSVPLQWGAFWLTEPGAPKGTSEIDIAEQWAETSAYGTIASNLLKFDPRGWEYQTQFDMDRDTNVNRVVMDKVGAEEWHNYALEWTPTDISVYVDGVKKWTYNPPIGFDKPMVPMFNLATLGSEGTMGVRNVEVYDKKPTT